MRKLKEASDKIFCLLKMWFHITDMPYVKRWRRNTLNDTANFSNYAKEIMFRDFNLGQKHLESFEMWWWRRMERISWTDHLRNKEVLLRVKEQRNILHEITRRKANWIGHILHRNCLPKRVIGGKIKGGLEVTGRRGRRRRKLLDDLKERRGYSHLKEEALDRTMWRARFGRGFGPIVRQATKWMNDFNCNMLLLINKTWFTLRINIQQRYTFPSPGHENVHVVRRYSSRHSRRRVIDITPYSQERTQVPMW